MDCKWEQFGNQYKCSVCGFIWYDNTYRKNCKNPNPVEIPSLIQRGKNLGRAVVEHIRTGMQHCTDEQKQSRFEICQSNQCGRFVITEYGAICSHPECGCCIRGNRRFMDKLSWADSKCPVGMWLAVEPKSQEIS